MTDKRNPSKKYRKVDPEDYYNYDDQSRESSGGGSGSKSASGKGPKTLKNLQRQQRIAAQDQRLGELEDALCAVLDGFPDFETEDQRDAFLNQYISWVDDSLRKFSAPDPSQLEIRFSKASGPGGQNVNKRETKVSLVHKPTQIRVTNDQTRSQADNRELAQEQLMQRLQDHIRDWKLYLGSGQKIDPQLVLELLEREL